MAVATVRAQAAEASAKEKKRKEAADSGRPVPTEDTSDPSNEGSLAKRTDDTVEKFCFAKVITDYFLPAVLLSPE